MSQTGQSNAADVRAGGSQNRRVALGLLAFAAFMIGLSFAAVPLYRMFCSATGYAGTPRRSAVGSAKIAPETMTVRFDSNVSPGLPWSFSPVQNEITVHIGENKLAFFQATNLSKEPVTGSAVFNVNPDIMGQYFTKVQCFCFTEQTLQPGETVEMPVSFFIDPEILKDRDAKIVRGMTLSYTFFKTQNPSVEPAPAAAANRADASLAKPHNPG